MNNLEILYSPSQWSKRYKPNEVIKYHVQFATEESRKARETVPCELNVSYGSGDKQKFDIYGSDLPNDAPIFIFIHGGYWQELNKDISSYVVGPFYRKKIKTIVIGYTLCPDTSLREIIKEIETAVKKCIEYAKKCGSKNISISGYSAGSHLIAGLFTNFLPALPEEEKKLFKTVILCCGVYDLTPLIDTYINLPLKLNYEEAKNLSPIFQNVPNLTCVVHIVVGENDSPAFLKQSEMYYEKIKNLGNVTFKVIKNVDHFSIVEKFSEDDYELVKVVTSVK